eukprot:TRINITY_DN23840_c0_g1_i1.p2 TRINITY_DN23840_c0_g1~~TRINITY_DN23840_c0_g1_i1.p2  ORF type:complete len:311 (+),score=45.90 TRINITY_DN23840_c0_g1_i1:98-1030(+)
MNGLYLQEVRPRACGDFSDTSGSGSDRPAAWIDLDFGETTPPGEDTGQSGQSADESKASSESPAEGRPTAATVSQPSSSELPAGAHTGNTGDDLLPDENQLPELSLALAGCDRCPEGRLCDLCTSGMDNQQMQRDRHAQGTCQPCAYAARKADGCRKGISCPYCHLCDNRGYQAWKRRVRRERMLEERNPQTATASDASNTGDTSGAPTGSSDRVQPTNPAEDADAGSMTNHNGDLTQAGHVAVDTVDTGGTAEAGNIAEAGGTWQRSGVWRLRGGWQGGESWQRGGGWQQGQSWRYDGGWRHERSRWYG